MVFLGRVEFGGSYRSGLSKGPTFGTTRCIWRICWHEPTAFRSCWPICGPFARTLYMIQSDLDFGYIQTTLEIDAPFDLSIHLINVCVLFVLSFFYSNGNPKTWKAAGQGSAEACPRANHLFRPEQSSFRPSSWMTPPWWPSRESSRELRGGESVRVRFGWHFQV